MANVAVGYVDHVAPEATVGDSCLRKGYLISDVHSGGQWIGKLRYKFYCSPFSDLKSGDQVNFVSSFQDDAPFALSVRAPGEHQVPPRGVVSRVVDASSPRTRTKGSKFLTKFAFHSSGQCCCVGYCSQAQQFVESHSVQTRMTSCVDQATASAWPPTPDVTSKQFEDQCVSEEVGVLSLTNKQHVRNIDDAEENVATQHTASNSTEPGALDVQSQDHPCHIVGSRCLLLFQRMQSRWDGMLNECDRQDYIKQLEEKLSVALDVGDQRALRSVFRAIVAALTRPRMQGKGDEYVLPGSEPEAISKFRNNIQEHLRMLTLRCLKALDLNDDRNMPALNRIVEILQRFESRHGCLKASTFVTTSWWDMKTFLVESRCSAAFLSNGIDQGSVINQKLACAHGKQLDHCSLCKGCPHGKLKQNCALCVGCVHGKLKHLCVVCGQCSHGKFKRNCIKCCPCPHGKLKRLCTQCKGCMHGRLKHHCASCSGRGCPHGKLKKHCSLCFGCPHNRLKKNCADCIGCPHGKVKSHCKDCRACPHGKLKRHCIECGACPHGKVKRNCVQCSGCEHGEWKQHCLTCSGCPHGKPVVSCSDCSGCPHGKLKKNCPQCIGCPHGRLRKNCAQCGGCPHGRVKRCCVECSGCEHGKVKINCVQCSGCPHGRLKQNCATCSACVHGKVRGKCKDCRDHQKDIV